MRTRQNDRHRIQSLARVIEGLVAALPQLENGQPWSPEADALMTMYDLIETAAWAPNDTEFEGELPQAIYDQAEIQ